MCAPPDTHTQHPEPLVPTCLTPKLSLPGREGWRASNSNGGRFGNGVGTYGRGQGRRCQNGEPLQRKRGREEASKKMGARQASSPSSRLQRGSGKSSPGPFQRAGMGDKPQVARDRQGPGSTQHSPSPTQASKWRLAAAAARLCPGMGWGWQAGRAPNQMPPAWAWLLPADNADPTSPSPEPSRLELWGWRKTGAKQKSGVQQTKPGLLKLWAGPQDPTKMALPGTARVTGFGKNKSARPEGAKSRGPGGSATLGRQLPLPHPQAQSGRTENARCPSRPSVCTGEARPSCPSVLGRQHRFCPQNGERVASCCRRNRPRFLDR